MRRSFVAALLLIAAPSLAADKRPITVVDSIEMTTLVEPFAEQARTQSGDAKFSPDGKSFFVVTKKGNLTTGENEFSLLLFDAARMREAVLQDGAKLSPPRVLARFRNNSNRNGIARALWLEDSHTIAFLAENSGQTSQLHTVDVRTGQVKKLTSHPTSLVGFVLDAKSDRFLYTAEAKRDWKERRTHGFTVGTESMHDVFWKGQETVYTYVSFFVGRRDGGKVQPVALEPFLGYVAQYLPVGMALSPNGKFALAVRHVANPPAGWWHDYTPVANFSYVADGGAETSRRFAGSHPSFFLQYVLIDLTTGKAEPVLDAPASFIFGGTAANAHFLSEDRIILANTFLPLAGANGEELGGDELARRKQTPMIVEVDRRTRRITPIAALADAITSVSGVRHGTYMGSTLDAAGQLEVVSQPPVQTAGRATTYQRYARDKDGTWHAFDSAASARAAPPLRVSIAQSSNEPPELRATDTATGRTRMITDLNPQFRSIELGKIDSFEWTDAVGRKWVGGLIKPPDYQPGKRYPLLLQTHGWDPNNFWIDGNNGATAGYAGRAMAARGIVVVQVPDGVGGVIGKREEIENQMPGYAALIDKLDKEGLIDRDRVGIHGFSRTGFYVQHAITFSDIKFAAASVADPSNISLLSEIAYYGLAYPSMTEIERMVGAPFFGDENVKTWVERDPVHNLARIHTPLRIENHSGIGSWWDTFTLLRRHGRPVEYVYFPDGSHNLLKPWERMTAQQGIVDWYDFWLNGSEDPDPKKAEQYVRWHELKRLQETSVGHVR